MAKHVIERMHESFRIRVTNEALVLSRFSSFCAFSLTLFCKTRKKQQQHHVNSFIINIIQSRARSETGSPSACKTKTH